MTVRTAVVRLWLIVLTAASAGLGCGAKPPYRVSESRLPSAQEIRRLGRIELADAAGPRDAGATPRVWIGVPDRRAEGAIGGAILVGIVGAAIGGGAMSGGGGWFAEIAIFQGMLVGGAVGAGIGAPLGAIMGNPGEESRRAARALRRGAESVDVGAAAREGASGSPQLTQRGTVHGAAARRGVISVEVVAYGTRAAGGGKARPFVAVHSRLVDASTGAVIYDAVRDWRGPRRQFPEWADNGGAEFRRVLEVGARRMGRRSVERVLGKR